MAPINNAEPPDPKYFGWRGVPPLTALAACYSDNGGAIFWGLKDNYEVWCTAEALRGWSFWYHTEWSGPGQPKRMVEMAATAIENQGLQFWALDFMGDLWSAAMAVPGQKFEPWIPNWNDAPKRSLRRLAAVHGRKSNSAAIWAIQSDYSLISCYKQVHGNTWTQWKPWPLTPEKSQFVDIAAALQHDGRAALWAIDTKLQLWCCYEKTPGGEWSNWNGPNWNGAPKLVNIAACKQGGSHGAILWGVKQVGYSLISTSQVPDGNWNNWSADGWQGSNPVIRLAAALQQNGTVRLWATQEMFLAVRSIAQTSPGGPWGGWDG